MSRLIIVGAGGHGRAVAEAAIASGEVEVVGFLNDSYPALSQALGLPVLGGLSMIPDLLQSVEMAIVAIGNNEFRKNICLQLRAKEFELATVIHPRASISPSAVVGAGSVILMGAVVGTESLLGEGVIVNCGAIVDHHARVGDFGHLGVNASMAGGSVLGGGAWMQAGSALGCGVCVPVGQVLSPGEAVSQC